MQKWIDFYRPYFANDRDVRDFVTACEALAPPKNRAKVMMHQAQRLISLSDDIPKIRQHDESLRLLFLLMCAENIAKLHGRFEGDGQSRRYVRQFFEAFLAPADRDILGIAFADYSQHLMPMLSPGAAIDMLYDVRCDVVHEGNYSDFVFHDGNMPMLNTDPNVMSHITFEQFRALVVRGCINAVRTLLSAP